MRQRVDCHRRRRPPVWHTIEAPYDADRALLRAATPLVLLDCLTLLAANAFLRAVHSFPTAQKAVRTSVRSLVGAAAQRGGCLIVVTNEVGFGIVPDNEQGRWFRDLLGEANCYVAARAATVTLLVAGCPVILKREFSG
jgi:adenosylcobinamide kinase/adenosylcobinamide-phosphate guanylyltransferase